MLGLLLISWLTLCQNPQPVDHRRQYAELYTAADVDMLLPGTFDSVRSIDFRNFETVVLDDSRKVVLKPRLRKGSWEIRRQHSIEGIKFRSVQYPPRIEGEPERVVVQFDFWWVGGSSCGSMVMQILELRGKQLYLTQNIEYGNREEPASRFDWKANTLDLTAIHPCDANVWDFKLRLRFRWNGAKFKLSSIREIATPFR